ncbi:hypothetical protein BH92_10895 [Rhodococcoides fascians A21d2]|uniref:hydantoinase/oxoprolinase N-terminal domain-containing protein n=1 Tax=Rhodococcoides fascians TaxID=1828 RepID=UPI0009B824CA|nr:hydantoinase/oxoprolinase N-terminal domain-containing protein [Rhodococcus fascians]QII00313.1 hypothetical protein BH92_10895 [Rhodococcus fascians A21d2]
MSFVIGLDIGGTFTDAYATNTEGRVYAAKAPSTPPDFEQGFLDAVDDLVVAVGVSTRDLLSDTALAWQDGGGYGDALRREPSAVAADVLAGRVSQLAAHTIYGVIVGNDGGAVDAATVERRAEPRRQRSTEVQNAQQRDDHSYQ